MTRVHVFGASGYAGLELIRYLSKHPQAEIGTLASRSAAGTGVASIPDLRHCPNVFETPETLAGNVRSGDAVFLAGTHREAAVLAPEFLAAGARVIDLSPEFRTTLAHGAVYGFPERYRGAIQDATMVANPGCYPTATLLALLPLGRTGMPIEVIVDAKSGITGAGRSPSTAALFAEVEGEVRAYGLDGHRHEPEIEKELNALGLDAELTFTPQVVPLSRGMLACVYCTFAEPVDPAAVQAAYAQAYDGNPFVCITASAPSLRAVAATNDAEIHVTATGRVVRIICAIDNLGKGAAGQAIQNFNLMHGFPEELGLHDCALAV